MTIDQLAELVMACNQFHSDGLEEIRKLLLRRAPQ